MARLNQIPMWTAFVFALAIPLALSAQTASIQAANSERMSLRPADPLNQTAFDDFYNMDYDRSAAEFEQVLHRHAGDPFAMNHYAMALLYRELFRRGLLNTGEYANDNFVKTPHQAPDPKFQQQFQNLVQQALDEEDRRLAANPKDIDALYARGVTKAQFSVYTGLLQRAWLSALRNAVSARKDEESVLEIAPETTPAKLIVGTHLYVVGSLPWSLRTAGNMFGLGGNKEKGLAYLRECAKVKGETGTDAKILLVLFNRRERRFTDALAIAHELSLHYPRNLLMALEEGNLLRDSGDPIAAEAAYRRVYQAGREGRFGNLHYEIAAMSLADLLRNQKDYAGAATTYELAAQVPNADPDILQQANLGAGEMYDCMRKRDLALKKYGLVVSADASSKNSRLARDYMKEPYKAE